MSLTLCWDDSYASSSLAQCYHQAEFVNTILLYNSLKLVSAAAILHLRLLNHIQSSFCSQAIMTA